MDITPLFRSSSGLNTKLDPVRVKYVPDSGASDLTTAVNITHDATGRPSRRSGYSLLQSGNFHSLFCDGGDCFVGKDKNLYKVGTDYSITSIRGSLSGNRIGFCQIDDLTYYANGTEKGYIKGGLSYPWLNPKEYVNPDSTREFLDPPIGTHIATYNGRIYISQGNILWYSEPFGYSLFDLARNFIMFSSDIRMVKPVDKGIFVSDSKDIWLLKGDDAPVFTLEKKAPYPALEWSDAIDYIEVLDLGFPTPGLGALWATTNGAMLGTAEGLVFNLTKEKVTYPSLGAQGAGLLRDNHFIHSLFF